MAYKRCEINAAARRDPVRAFDLFEPIDPRLAPKRPLIHEFVG